MSNLMTFEDALKKLLLYYGEHYEIQHNLAVGGQKVQALAALRIKEEKTLFGFKVSGVKTRSTEAGEYILFVFEEFVDVEAARRLVHLVELAEQQYVDVHDEHGYSFISVVALTRGFDPEATAIIKKHKLRKNYASGWGMGRICVLDLNQNVACCNKDGKELESLLIRELKK